METEKLTMSVAEARSVLGLGRSLIYEKCRTGALPCIRVGKRILISRPALERMLAEAGGKKLSEE